MRRKRKTEEEEVNKKIEKQKQIILDREGEISTRKRRKLTGILPNCNNSEKNGSGNKKIDEKNETRLIPIQEQNFILNQVCGCCLEKISTCPPSCDGTASSSLTCSLPTCNEAETKVKDKKTKKQKKSKEENLVIVPLQCSHAFHYTCLMSWANRETTCPLCKNIFEEGKVYVKEGNKRKIKLSELNSIKFDIKFLVDDITSDTESETEDEISEEEHSGEEDVSEFVKQNDFEYNEVDKDNNIKRDEKSSTFSETDNEQGSTRNEMEFAANTSLKRRNKSVSVERGETRGKNAHERAENKRSVNTKRDTATEAKSNIELTKSSIIENESGKNYRKENKERRNEEIEESQRTELMKCNAQSANSFHFKNTNEIDDKENRNKAKRKKTLTAEKAINYIERGLRRLPYYSAMHFNQNSYSSSCLVNPSFSTSKSKISSFSSSFYPVLIPRRNEQHSDLNFLRFQRQAKDECPNFKENKTFLNNFNAFPVYEEDFLLSSKREI